jgi:glycosyltransferase involved in cell wall biosynthesis
MNMRDPFKLSVVICSHNPRSSYLERVLRSLASQDLDRDCWELLLIDNVSAKPLSADYDLSWHPHSRHVREEELGLTAARLRGISEAAADLLVFVDDDNVLEPDFLAAALELSERFPFLGAWGGDIAGEFETPPPDWTRPFWRMLAIRDVTEPLWSNSPDDWRTQPCGAGLCIRSSVGRHYLERLQGDPIGRSLDRKGQSLSSAGDTDLVYAAAEVGLGWGTFPQLRLKHLMPHGRLTEEYLVRLIEGVTASSVALLIRRGSRVELTPSWKVWLRAAQILLLKGRREFRFYLAHKRGTAAGVNLASSLYRPKSVPSVGRVERDPVAATS